MPRVILQTRFTDDTVQHEYHCGDIDLNAALGWAVRNWHPAQGPRIDGGEGFYLNHRLLVSIGGAEFVPVAAAMARAYTPVGLAA